MKQVFVLVVVLGIALLLPGVVAAGPCDQYCTEANAGASQQELAAIDTQGHTCICNPLQTENLTDIINNILTVLFNFALVLTPLMVVVAGIMFVTAGGSPDRVSTAKQILLWTAVGFVIILLARGLIVVIRAIIGF